MAILPALASLATVARRTDMHGGCDRCQHQHGPAVEPANMMPLLNCLKKPRDRTMECLRDTVADRWKIIEKVFGTISTCIANAFA